jgi:hypothetical protein
VTQTAATLLGDLAQQLRPRGHAPQPVAHFMTRVLFCLFAEDIGLLPDRLFSTLVEESRRTPADFPGLARDLFRAMHQGGRFGLARIAWFNGGLLDDDHGLPLERADHADLTGRSLEVNGGGVDVTQAKPVGGKCWSLFSRYCAACWP